MIGSKIKKALSPFYLVIRPSFYSHQPLSLFSLDKISKNLAMPVLLIRESPLISPVSKDLYQDLEHRRASDGER